MITALRRPGRQLCYGYHADLDGLGHEHGPGSLPWRMQLSAVDRLAALIADHLPADAVLAVTGDHGMVTRRPHGRHRHDPGPDPRRATWSAATPRARLVYARPGAAADVLATWRGLLGDDALVLPREQAVAEGWFGAVSPRVVDRIGDIVAVARGRTGAGPHAGGTRPRGPRRPARRPHRRRAVGPPAPGPQPLTRESPRTARRREWAPLSRESVRNGRECRSAAERPGRHIAGVHRGAERPAEASVGGRRRRSSRSPSSADAPLGSPSTPFGLTAATPPARIAGSSSSSGAGLPPAASPPDARGGQREHQRCLGPARMGVAAGGAGEPGGVAALVAQQADGVDERRDVPAVAVDEHQPPRPSGRRPPQLDEQQPQRLVPDRHGARGSPRAPPTRRTRRAARRAGSFRSGRAARRRRPPPARRCPSAGAGRAARWTRRARAASAGRRSPATPARPSARPSRIDVAVT